MVKISKHREVMEKEISRGFCMCCGKTFLKISIHHVNGKHEDNKKNNLVPVCSRCHALIHKGFQKRSDIRDDEIIERILMLRQHLIHKNYGKDTNDFLNYEKAIALNVPINNQKCYFCGSIKNVKVIPPYFVLKFDPENRKNIGLPQCLSCIRSK